MRLPQKIYRGPGAREMHLAAIEIAILLWTEHTKLPLETMPDIYITYQHSGYANWHKDLITIPKWIFDPGVQSSCRDLSDNNVNFVVWYIAHELAHIISPGSNHGPKFMEVLKVLCPERCQYYEYGYKPRNAKAAGLSRRGARDDQS